MHAIEFVLYGATVTIDDQENPDFTAPHVVAASDGRWHNASAIDVTLPAAEDNTGIRERRAYLDGDLAHAWTAPGAAQGGCGELNAGVAYTFTQPCADGRGLNDAMATTLPVAAVPDGVHALHFEAVDTGGGSASSGSFTLRLDRLPPAVSVGTPGSLAGGQALAVDATYADSTSGVVRTEEEVRVDDGSWQPASGVVEPGRTYRFRARAYDAAGNVSAWVESGPVRVPEAGATEAPPNDAPALGGNSSVARPAPITAPSPGAGTPRPHTASRAPGKPRIRSATLRVGELRTRGTLPVAATGKVTVRFTARAGGRTRTVRRRVTIARGRWTVRITLRGRLRQAPRGTLTVRYAGNAAVAPGVTTRVVRTATRPRAA